MLKFASHPSQPATLLSTNFKDTLRLCWLCCLFCHFMQSLLAQSAMSSLQEVAKRLVEQISWQFIFYRRQNMANLVIGPDKSCCCCCSSNCGCRLCLLNPLCQKSKKNIFQFLSVFFRGCLNFSFFRLVVGYAAVSCHCRCHFCFLSICLKLISF